MKEWEHPCSGENCDAVVKDHDPGMVMMGIDSEGKQITLFFCWDCSNLIRKEIFENDSNTRTP